ncbi:MAG: NUDIX hydrolase [Acidimicrobiia bacterium]|nr:NUDIX hydrolase [Acidimicrobiia bacterium]
MERKADVSTDDLEDGWREYVKRLPGKRVGVGCVLGDNQGRIVVVKPTYKQGWSIPGGGVDVNESPWQACKRELREELGLELDPGSFLCLDYLGPRDGFEESIQILYDGGELTPDQLNAVVIPTDELEQWALVSRGEAEAILRPELGRRVAAVQGLLGTGTSIYLEDGKPL